MSKIDSLHPNIREFAEGLIKKVRDPAIAQCDAIAEGKIRVARWEKAGINKELLHEVIPDVVDRAIFYLLKAIDNGDLPLTYKATDLCEEGSAELAGWSVGTDSFKTRYSKERLVDLEEMRALEEKMRNIVSNETDDEK
jgi:hypothetical protein